MYVGNGAGGSEAVGFYVACHARHAMYATGANCRWLVSELADIMGTGTLKTPCEACGLSFQVKSQVDPYRLDGFQSTHRRLNAPV